MIDLRDRFSDDIPDLPDAPHILVGEGVWGEVYDLGDGSVLKLVRRNGGLGSGESKYLREVAAFALLDKLPSGQHLPRLPRLIAAGRFANPYGMQGAPLAGWLRISKLSGSTLDEGRLYSLRSEERERLGEEIGAAIADFHLSSVTLAEGASLFGRASTRNIDEALSRIIAPDQRARLEKLKEMWLAEQGTLVLLHGDLNFSNMIHDRTAKGEARIGLIDFAEISVGFPEEDFRHFDNPGPMRDAIFRTYAAVTGTPPDMQRFHMSVAVGAAITLAIGSNSGHPREAMRRVSFLDAALTQAGI